MKQSLYILSAIIAIICLAYLSGCNYGNIQDIKDHSAQTLEAAGWKITGYEGYQIGSFDSPGGKVWYQFVRPEQPGIVYDAAISKWFGEYHIYNLKAINAISGN